MVKTPPPKGEASLAGVLPFAGVSGSAPMRVVVVEYIILLIIIIDGPVDFPQLHFCQTVQLELSFFFHLAYALVS